MPPVAETEMEKLAEQLYKDVNAQFGEGKQLNMFNMFAFVRLAMEIAETFEELPGRDKKKLVIRVCQEALEDHALEDREDLQFFVDKILDMTIDQFVDIDMGHLHINEAQKHRIKTFFKKIFPCLK
jgi:hypothetical protein